MLENMNTLEKQVFRTYWNDGLLDVFAAVAVLATGMFWLADLPVGGAIVPALLIPLWAPFRQRFVEPRLGLVEFSHQRERRNAERLRLVAFLGIGTLVLAIAIYFARTRLGVNPAISLVAGLPAVLLAILAIVTAFLVSTPRFLAYAALLAVAGIVGAQFGLEPGPILVLAAVPILAGAMAVLLRFLRNNPLDEESV